MVDAKKDQVVRRIAAAVAAVAEVMHFETRPRSAAGSHATGIAGQDGIHPALCPAVVFPHPLFEQGQQAHPFGYALLAVDEGPRDPRRRRQLAVFGGRGALVGAAERAPCRFDAALEREGVVLWEGEEERDLKNRSLADDAFEEAAGESEGLMTDVARVTVERPVPSSVVERDGRGEDRIPRAQARARRLRSSPPSGSGKRDLSGLPSCSPPSGPVRSSGKRREFWHAPSPVPDSPCGTLGISGVDPEYPGVMAQARATCASNSRRCSKRSSSRKRFTVSGRTCLSHCRCSDSAAGRCSILRTTCPAASVPILPDAYAWRTTPSRGSRRARPTLWCAVEPPIPRHASA